MLALAALAAAGCGSSSGGARGDGGDASGRLAVRVEPSTARLRPDATFRAQATPTARIVAARGESEGVQVQLAPRTGAARVRARVRGLDLDTTVYDERPIAVTHASPGGATGTYLDPLLPITAGHATPVDAGATTVLWVDVHVPRDAPAGVHHGRLELRLDGGRDGKVDVPITVQVGSATLPKSPHLASSIGLDESQLERLEQPGSSAADRADMRDRYFAMLADMRLSPGDLSTPPSLGTDPAAFAASPDADWLVRALDRPGVNGARIPIYATFPFEHPLTSDRARTVDYLRTVAAYYRAHGWFDESYVYVVDEPGDGDVPLVRDWAKLVHEADPELRLLVTHAPSGAFAGLDVDIPTANVSERVVRDEIERTHAQGHRYWWYPGISTHEPYPTLFIDDERPSPRLLGWLAARYGVDGFLYYSATHWHEVRDPWKDPGTWHNPDGAIGNGDGVLVYPGRGHGIDGPAPSVRLLQLRDGIEDDDLVQLAGGRADDLVAQVAPSLDASTSPAALEHAHDRLVTLAAG